MTEIAKKQKPGALAILVKTPGLSSIKTRLAEHVGREATEKFYLLACAATAAVMKRTQVDYPSLAFVPYWAVAENSGMKFPAWKDFAKLEQGEGGFSQRLARSYSQLIESHPFVLFIGADTPQVTPEIFADAIRHLSTPGRYVVGTAEDGGFYMIGGSGPIQDQIWKSVQYSSWQTGEMMTQKLSSLGPVRPMTAIFDVDTPEDLSRLRKLLGSRKDTLPEQKALVQWLKESGF